MRVRSLGWLPLLFGVAGCEQLFGLNEVPTPPPDAPPPSYHGRVIEDPDGDLDGDGVPNATDPCPLIDARSVPNAATDFDGDGVGDACDPHPRDAGDCLALFDDFQHQAAPAPVWKWTGDPLAIVDNRSLAIPRSGLGNEAFVYLDRPLDLDAVFVWAYVQNGDNPMSGERHAVQVFFDLAVSPTVNGTACGAESNGISSQVTASSLVAGTESLAMAQPIGSNLVGIPNDITLDWGTTPGTCKGAVGPNDGAQSAVLALDPPPSGVFGLRAFDTGLHVYAIAGWGHACQP